MLHRDDVLWLRFGREIDAGRHVCGDLLRESSQRCDPGFLCGKSGVTKHGWLPLADHSVTTIRQIGIVV